jgi:hypothetical protein
MMNATPLIQPLALNLQPCVVSLPALLDRAWIPSLPARSGFALSLREIRLARSQRARLKGEL